MPLYEIVLRFPDREEIRLTDRNGYRPGERVVIAQKAYVVLGTESPQAAGASERFVLMPADDRRRPLG